MASSAPRPPEPAEAHAAAAPPCARLLPLPLLWALAVCLAAFAAFVVLPAGFVLAGLTRPGPASLTVRLSLLEMLVRGVTHPQAWIHDPLRSVTTAIGLLAGVGAVGLLIALAVPAVRRGRDCWPRPSTALPGLYRAAVALLGVASLSLAAASLVMPVPARPLEWWFLGVSLAWGCAWLAGRRAWAWAPTALLGGLVGAAAVVDVAVFTGAPLGLPGGWLVGFGAVSALLGSMAAARAALRSGGAVPERHEPPLAAITLTIAAVVFGLAVVVVSAAPAWSGPSRTFPPAGPGSRAVVVVAHIDDEAAFAGETIAWLASHGYEVTVVVATDSRGGRALDKDHRYRPLRDAALAASARILGVAHTVVFEDVPDGARMTRRSMEAAIARDLERRAPIAPGTIVVVVSGTGHPNHLATFDAASEVASAAGLPLYVAWGYDKGHDLESRPLTGTPLAFDGGPAASAAKALATDGYIGLYEDHYAFTLPRAIVLARGSHDVLSRIETTGGVGAP